MLARKKKRQIKRERKRKNPHLCLRSFFQNVPPQNDIFVHPHCVRGPRALRRTRPHLERNTSALKYSETLHYRSKRRKKYPPETPKSHFEPPVLGVYYYPRVLLDWVRTCPLNGWSNRAASSEVADRARKKKPTTRKITTAR